MRTFSASAWFGLFLLAILPVAARADTVDVSVGPGGDFVFSPEDIVVDVGDTVRWTWDSEGHNVGSGLPGDPTPFFLSGPPAPAGTVFEVLFDQAFLDANPVLDSVYDYHCHPHGDFGMVGSVTVVCGEDINADGVVNVLDLIDLLLCFGQAAVPGCESEDVNRDGTVNVLDLIDVLLVFGEACP
ncbi:MAG: hypothetical protein ACYSTY_13540 [Planctomycetota bacterium]|jgi:plastocyanin